jgi:amidase
VTATWSASRLAAAIRAKELSSRDLLELYVRRIERLGGPINAVVSLALERARAEAAAADDVVANGGATGPLHGLPITVKDAIATAGLRSTGGAVELARHVPTEDAPAVAQLRAAGAIVIGKTNLPRWSMETQTFGELFGTTSNPWSPGRTPGGSSGGAAAAVSAGLTSFELGTDIGGSIRQPSHFCGVFGLKPSYGLVPQRGYLDHVGGGTIDTDMNVFGPIARSATDLDLLLGVLAGPEPASRPAWRVQLPAAGGQQLRDYRIGVFLDDPACALDRDYLAVLRDGVDALAGAGARVEQAAPPATFAEHFEVFVPLIAAATSVGLPAEWGEALAGNHRAWLGHHAARMRLRAAWSRWFESYDLLLCPVAATAAFPHHHDGDLADRTITVNGQTRSLAQTSAWWCGVASAVGLPVAVPPIGRTAEGLPVGVQVIAPFWHDRRAVAVAGHIADVLGGYRPPPDF